MWCIHTHTHTGILLTQPLKKNEMLPFATTSVDLENIIFSEIIQSVFLSE